MWWTSTQIDCPSERTTQQSAAILSATRRGLQPTASAAQSASTPATKPCWRAVSITQTECNDTT